MAYLNTHTRTTKPTSNDLMQTAGRMPSLFGVHVGFVKDAADVQKNGRIRVWVPELGSAPDNQEGWIIANYCSPFAGATNIDTTNTTDVKQFEGTQTSYGMWMVPPDINNQVLIMFINGDPSRGIWIGCLYNQFMNNMVPGTASDTNNYQYPGKDIPVAEYNKNDTRVSLPDQATHPYEATKFRGLGNQGLINDPQRGVTKSSARRESPSQVFGILTPGPAIDPNVAPDKIRRKGGSAFIMDDKTGSEYIQLTTKSGAQININETTGFVYLINRDGTAWVQMDAEGNVDIFGAKNISMRAQRDFNIRADRNINIEAGQNIFMKAAKDTKQETTTFTYDVNNIPTTKSIPVWNFVGEGNGDATGGNIVLQSLNNLQSTSHKGAFLTVKENNLEIKVGNTINVTTDSGGQNFNSKLGIKMTTDASFDLAVTNNIRAGAKGSASIVGEAGLVLCTGGHMSLNAGANLITASAGSTSIHADTLQIDASVVNMNTLNADIVNSTTIAVPMMPLGNGSPLPPAPENTKIAEGALSASPARPAEVKPLNDKINILATWKASVTYFEWNPSTFYNIGNIVKYTNLLYIANRVAPASATFDIAAWDFYVPEDKFKRNAKTIQTTVSTLPTYEPCPEHAAFNSASITGNTPIFTPDDNTYQGSAGAGNDANMVPPAAVDAGATNTSVAGDPLNENSVAKDINTAALKCQLSVHEGIKNTSYPDSGGISGGIGHLMRANEAPLYPLGTPISADQIESWYTQDSSSAIKIAQDFMGDTWGELSDIRKRAMTDLAYNLGKYGLGKFVNFIAAMKAKDFNRASQELRNSAWFTQVGRRGPNIVVMITQNVDPNNCNKKFPG